MNSALESITNSVEQKPSNTGNGKPVQEDVKAIDSTAQNGKQVDLSTLEQRSLNPERFLYTELVKAHLGEKAAMVIDTLVGLGRLTARELAQKIPSMDIKTIKTTLVALIQLRCIRHLDETNPHGKRFTYYYYNEDGLLMLLYSGQIIEEIKTRLPQTEDMNSGREKSASRIVETVLSLGSLSLDDYLATVDPQVDQFEIISTFVKLCEMGFLIPLNKLHYTPINDLWTMLYDKEYIAIPRNSTLSDLKKRQEAKGKAKIQFLNLMNSSNDLSKILVVDNKTSLRTVKRHIPLTFNLERFLKTRRTKNLIQFAKSRTGITSALVYKAALRLTEQKSPNLVDPFTYTGLLEDLDEAITFKDERDLADEKTPGLTFNAVDLAKHLPQNIDLRGSLTGIHKRDKNNNTNKRTNENKLNNNPPKKLKTEDGFVIPPLPDHLIHDMDKNNEPEDDEDEEDDTNHDFDFDENDDDPHSVVLVNSHLRLLSTSSVPFLRECKPGVFYIPFTKLMPVLRSSMYDYIISSTLGPSAMRIRRCVTDNKLASEKVINSTALMREKDIRSTISSLIKYNVLEIQEVPRTVDRSAARAVFLFRSKEDHSYRFMKQNLAWNIANLLYKKETLKEQNETLLTKTKREDVKGKEAELLLPSELNQLKMIRERELNSYVRITRLLSLWEVFNFI